jgi:HK97 family phage portal protein
MGIRDMFNFGRGRPASSGARVRAEGTAINITDLNDVQLEQVLRGGSVASSGAVVNMASAMGISTAWRCTLLLAGICGNFPADVMKRVSETVRVPAEGHPLRTVMTERPNGWQTPSEFRKMLTAHVVNKGDGFALKITSMGRVIELWPLDDPDRMEVVQNDDMTLSYTFTTRKGRRVQLGQADVLHLRGFSTDGIRGIGVLRAARDALGLSMTMQAAGGRMFKNGVLAGGAVKLPQGSTLSDEAYERLKADLDQNNAGPENAGKLLILEDGLDYATGMFSAADMQFLEGRRFSRTDIAMFYGVPPFLLGDTEKSTSWGTGLEQQNTGFIQYTGLDLHVMWEEACRRDLLTDADRKAGLYIKIDPRVLLRGDSKTRNENYARALGSGGGQPWMTVNEVRALEDLPPIEGGEKLPTRQAAPLALPPPKDDPNAEQPADAA